LKSSRIKRSTSAGGEDIMMTTPDLCIAAVILFSILIGIVRGFIKESISLVTWLVAIALSIYFAGNISQHMTFTKIGLVKSMVAFLVIFVGVVFIGAIVNYMVGSFIRRTPFSLPDRILGSAFGLFRGVALVSILVLLAGLTPLPEAPWWQNSYSINKFQGFALWLKDRLPDETAKVFRFPGDPAYTQDRELDQAMNEVE
jgi:membrane protein required for colicin V production